MRPEEFEQKKGFGIKVLKRIYSLSERNVNRQIKIEDIHKPDYRAWQESEVWNEISYWIQKEYVVPVGENPLKPRLFQISQKGIDYVEALPKQTTSKPKFDK